VLNWHYGIARGVLLGGIIAGLIGLRCVPHRVAESKPPPSAMLWIRRLLVLAVALNAGIAISTVIHTAWFHRIPLDEGQTSWRAARLLVRGENPYGVGAIVDYATFAERSAQRAAEGLQPSVPPADIDNALREYDKALDPALRARLLPATPASEHSVEAGLLGYKYGPLIMLLTVPGVLLWNQAWVMLLNACAYFGLFGVMYRLLGNTRGELVAGLGLIALLLDRNMSLNYLNKSATDIWPLFFEAVGVLAVTGRRPILAGIAMALACGSKVFPSVLLVPLILDLRSGRAVVSFLAALLALYLPWIAWDWRGMVDNIVLWPTLMRPDTTSWMLYVPPYLVVPIRTIVIMLIGMVWLRYLSRRETRLFWTLAMVNALILAAGGVLHNNYLTWASIWIIAAICETSLHSVDARNITLARGHSIR
jgi:hypothetical protein